MTPFNYSARYPARPDIRQNRLAEYPANSVSGATLSLSTIWCRSYGMPDVDEDELEAEFDALGDEIALDDDASYLGKIPQRGNDLYFLSFP